MKRNYKIIAVDFDGTLCENIYPHIGNPIIEVINYIKYMKRNGHKIILWTCRINKDLEYALKWCAEQGIIFDAVNENLPEILEEFDSDTRKIFADMYIDDRNVNVYSLINLAKEFPYW